MLIGFRKEQFHNFNCLMCRDALHSLGKRQEREDVKEGSGIMHGVERRLFSPPLSTQGHPVKVNVR